MGFTFCGLIPSNDEQTIFFNDNKTFSVVASLKDFPKFVKAYSVIEDTIFAILFDLNRYSSSQPLT
jgi:hypothetical protein